MWWWLRWWWGGGWWVVVEWTGGRLLVPAREGRQQALHARRQYALHPLCPTVIDHQGKHQGQVGGGEHLEQGGAHELDVHLEAVQGRFLDEWGDNGVKGDR